MKPINAAELLAKATTPAEINAVLRKVQRSFAQCFYVDKKVAVAGLVNRHRAVQARATRRFASRQNAS